MNSMSFSLLVIVIKVGLSHKNDNFMNKDLLSPFLEDKVETRRKNRLSHKYYEVFNSDKNAQPSHSVDSFIKTLYSNTYIGHKITITNGLEMLSVLEPKYSGGCKKKQLATVVESSKQRECIAAVSAGFFNENTGQCFGNLISDGDVVNQFKGLRSANFGIREDGSIVVGYIKESDLREMRHPLRQLITGVGWVLRNGEDYLADSLKHEQCNLDNLQSFFQAKSARTFLGHDSQGNINIIQIEGKTGIQG